MKKESLLNLVLVLVSIEFALFVFNATLVVVEMMHPPSLDYDGQRIAEARRMAVPYDERTPFEAFLDMLKTNPELYYADNPREFFENEQKIPAHIDRHTFFPYSSIAAKTLLYCNENGYYTTFHSDRYGFNNDDAIYSQKGNSAILMGDSFAQGACVWREDNAAGVLNKEGLRVINMGIAGNGPLLEYATLREYAAIVHPKKVIWLYFNGNDLDDLTRELAYPVLKRYLDDRRFTLGMAGRQREVDQYWKRYTEVKIAQKKRELEAKQEEEAHKLHTGTFFDDIPWAAIFELQLVRQIFDSLIIGTANSAPINLDMDSGLHFSNPDFVKTISEARRFSETLGAEFYFVYLPSYMDIKDGDANHDSVVKSIRGLGIPVIDFYEVLKRQPDPLAYYPFHVRGHFTPQAYHLLAEEIRRVAWGAGKGKE